MAIRLPLHYGTPRPRTLKSNWNQYAAVEVTDMKVHHADIVNLDLLKHNDDEQYITIGAIIVLCSSLMGSLLPQPRIRMAMAIDGLLPSVFSHETHAEISKDVTDVSGVKDQPLPKKGEISVESPLIAKDQPLPKKGEISVESPLIAKVSTQAIFNEK
ncbi:cationic amino acid transporter 2, vacuolar [Artemisia annua]|uniref:Cationic amino acid transporter 2, vacuolar n=1 Tax=Artemisia annua TaxID=35608 RepID=A0A2U1LPM4_ARTAN|nr:cationic amino acid transporter 2, vacuolar [Artemisia annua]